MPLGLPPARRALPGLVALAVVVAGLGLAGPGSSPAAADDLQVVSTTPVLTDRYAGPPTAGPIPVPAVPDRSGWPTTGTRRTTGQLRTASAARSTWRVTYDAGFAADALARSEFQRAVDTWSRLVGSAVPIRVDAHFVSLPDGVLGSAGPAAFVEQVPDGRYTTGERVIPVALANAMAGRDLMPATSSNPGFDIVAQFPSDNPDIHYGPGAVPRDQYDFYSTVLHELAHGLGFTTTFDVTSGRGSWGLSSSAPYVVGFDGLVTRGSAGTPRDLLAQANGSTALAGALTSGDVYWRGAHGVAGAGGVRPKLFAPSSWMDGSSIAHLDEATYPAGSPDALMTPAGAPGEVDPDPGDIALGILADLGWSVPVPSTTPTPSPTPTPAPSPLPDVPGSRFTPVDPVRLLDTRDGTGARAGRVGPGGTVDLTVTGGAVPAGATAVVLNVTAVGASAATDVRVYPTPDDASVPTVSNLNLAAGATRAALVTVPVGSGGRVRLRNGAGSVGLLADLAGWYAPSAATAFHPVTPSRLLDTREQADPTLGPGGTQDLVVAGSGGVPADAAAVVLTVTAVGATQSTDVAVYPAGDGAEPGTSTLNLTPGAPVPNLAVVRVGAGGAVRLRNSGGRVSLLVDVQGWYDAAGPDGLLFRPVDPVRVLDTRQAVDPALRRLGAGTTTVLDLGAGAAPLPARASAVLLNVTGVGASSSTDVRVYPRSADAAVPVVSSLNLAAGQTAADAVAVGLGTGRSVVLRNAAGSLALVADLAGWFGP